MHPGFIFSHRISLKGHPRPGVLREKGALGSLLKEFGAQPSTRGISSLQSPTQGLCIDIRHSTQDVQRSWRLKPELPSDGGGGDKASVVLKLPSLPDLLLCQPLRPSSRAPSPPLLLWLTPPPPLPTEPHQLPKAPVFLGLPLSLPPSANRPSPCGDRVYHTEARRLFCTYEPKNAPAHRSVKGSK